VDHNIGRVLDAVEETGKMDNTLIIYQMGDNGASGEGTLQGLANEVGVAGNGVVETVPYLLSIMDELGGPLTYNHYPVGWAHAMDTPFQWTKQVASHFGGTRNGLVISWPKRITSRSNPFAVLSVIDLVPTILDGRSRATFGDQRREADTDRRHQSGVFLTMPRLPLGTRPNTLSCSPTAASIVTDGWPAPLRLP
jgi:arylsulfatase A-like enzyme